MPSIWDRIRGWKEQPGIHHVTAHIPSERVLGKTNDDPPLKPNASYVRIWLVEMFLAKSRDWFVEQQPAVHSLVKLEFADQRGFECARVAAPSQNQYNQGEALLKNYVILPLVPFNGGTLELEAALLAMKGTNYVAKGIEVLADFASLVGTPLSQALDIAGKVKSGVEKLLGSSDVHLCYHDQRGGAGDNALKPGYIAIVLAPQNAIAAERLYVQGDQLLYAVTAGAKPSAIAKYDYMLLRVEGVVDRDDWQHFADISKLRDEAIGAFIQGERERGENLTLAGAMRLATHPDLALYDRREIAKKFAKEMAVYRDEGLGAAGDAPPAWNDFATQLPRGRENDTSAPDLHEILSAYSSR